MRLIEPKDVRTVDSYLINELGIDENELIGRAGNAVASAVRELLLRKGGGSVVFLIGSGNNGADGCAAALSLLTECEITLLDLSCGRKRSRGLEYYLDALNKRGVSAQVPTEDFKELRGASVIVDAIFGSGARSPWPDYFPALARAMTDSGALLLAVDVPMSADALTGAVTPYTPHFTKTLMLSYMKCGVVSYPAREYAGEIAVDAIGIDSYTLPLPEEVHRYYMTGALASELLPDRAENSSKGNFGRLLTLVGSERFFGAAALSLEASLRCGAGYVTSLGTEEQNSKLMLRFPEAIYKTVTKISELDSDTLGEICKISRAQTVTLVGCGSDKSEGLTRLLLALLDDDGGGALVLDADAINALSDLGEQGREALRKSKRRTVLTPHPLELSRLIGVPTEQIQSDRMRIAERFAKEHGVILVLKGAGTVTTDGVNTFINSSGSSALAKAGSGDVLAGALSSMLASGGASPTALCALAVYFHASAADTLAEEYSSYGVIPSDLPKQIAREISKAQSLKTH